MLIGTSGFAHGGKDTVADHLERRYGYTRDRYARDLKRRTAELFDFSPEQIEGALKEVPDLRYPMSGFCPTCSSVCSSDDGDGWYCEACKRLYPRHVTPRLAMQVDGNAMRALYVDVWVERTLRDIDPAARWVICDVRYPNEVRAIQRRGGKVIRLLRGAPESSHPSETSLIGFDGFDAVIDNHETTIERLHELVDACMNEWLIRPVTP